VCVVPFLSLRLVHTDLHRDKYISFIAAEQVFLTNCARLSVYLTRFPSHNASRD
jgi:hypothetical protein